MCKQVKRSIAVMGVVCLLLVALCGQAFAASQASFLTHGLDWATGEQKVLPGDSQERDTSVTLFDSTRPPDEPDNVVPILADGVTVGHGCMIGTTTCVSIREFGDMIGCPIEVAWDPATGELRASAPGLLLVLDPDARFMTANGRCLYLPDGAHYVDGTLFVPIRELARCAGAGVVWDAEEHLVHLILPENGPVFLAPAEESYVEEDLYWLSRIIHAEAGNQPLEGMIGVGNVVLNRVADPSCPDTIYDVIFDNRYGVQFSVTENGTIYLEPNELSVVAAKICLEGYDVVGDSLFFVNPRTGAVGWFLSTRSYVATIGDHAFYM